MSSLPTSATCGKRLGKSATRAGRLPTLAIGSCARLLTVTSMSRGWWRVPLVSYSVALNQIPLKRPSARPFVRPSACPFPRPSACPFVRPSIRSYSNMRISEHSHFRLRACPPCQRFLQIHTETKGSQKSEERKSPCWAGAGLQPCPLY